MKPRLAALALCPLALALTLACGDEPSPPEPAATPAAAPEPAPEPAAAEAPDPRPNLLLVVIDTTRRDRLGTYGYDRPTSPALDRIAAEGAVYENAVTVAPWTLPAHASIFTGLYPRDHGATIESYRLRDDFTTLAEHLEESGYLTAGFSCNPWINENNGFTQGFRHYEDIWRDLATDSRDSQGAALATDRALDWIDTYEPFRHPWFVFVNLLEPHSPYSPPPPHRYRFVPESLPLAAVQRVADWGTPREFGYMLGVPGYEISEDEFAAMNALYDGEISYQDTRLGALVEGLRMRGILDDTVVAIVSDHGEQLGEHGLLEHKMTLYDENVRVPLVLRHPPTVPAGQRIEAPVQSHDLFATLLDYAEVEAPLPRDAARLPLDGESPGRSHAVLEFGKPSRVLQQVARSFPGADIAAWDRSIRAVRGPRYKLIAWSDGERRLFDLQNDPGEHTDLAKRLPDKVRELEALLEHFAAGSPEPGAEAPEMDAQQIEALRALGYLP